VPCKRNATGTRPNEGRDHTASVFLSPSISTLWATSVGISAETESSNGSLASSEKGRTGSQMRSVSIPRALLAGLLRVEQIVRDGRGDVVVRLLEGGDRS